MNNFLQFFVSNGITTIAVPLYFAVSGFLFFQTSSTGEIQFASKMLKRRYSLLLPYLLWNGIGIGFLLICLRIEAINKFIPDYMKGKYTLNYLRSVYEGPVPFQLWFIRDLMGLVILSPLLYAVLKRPVGRLFLLLAACAWCYPGLPCRSEVEALLFFCLGSFVAIHDISVENVCSKTVAISFVVAWLSLLAVKTTLACGLIGHGVLLLLHKIAIILGLLAVWCGYDHFIKDVGEKSMILRLASFTFFIYAFHEPLQNVAMENLLGRIGSTPSDELFGYVVVPVLTIALAVVIASFLRRWSPSIYSLLTGGRGN